MATITLPFSEFVDTTSSEQNWQIYNSVIGVNVGVGPDGTREPLQIDSTGRLKVDSLNASQADLTIIENNQDTMIALLTTADAYLAQIETNTAVSGSGNQLVVTTYYAIAQFTVGSVTSNIGDTITSTQVVSASSTPTVIATLWYNQTQALPLSAAPPASALNLIGEGYLTNTQLRATAVPASVSSLPLPTGAATSAKQPALDGDGGALSHVTNFPSTQTVSGSVSVSNFPSTQPVSGAVSVSNFPSSQAVTNTGTFSVQNTAPTPAGSNTIGFVNVLGGNSTAVKVDGSAVTQPVSASSLPLPTGAATSANQPAINGDGGALAHITNFPSTQPVSGSVSVSSLPSTPTGTNSIGTVGLNAGTNTIGAVNIAASQSIAVTQATAANLNATVTGSVTANAGTNLNTSNLDVALSTRLKPADTLAAVTTVGTITNAVTVSQGTAANLNATVTGTVVANPTAGSITMSNSSVGTSSATLLAASSATKMLAIQNTSANTLYISTTSPATATNGILLSANQGYEFQVIPSNALYCLGSAASTTYTLWYL